MLNELITAGIDPDILNWVPEGYGRPGYTHGDLIEEGILTLEELIAKEQA